MAKTVDLHCDTLWKMAEADHSLLKNTLHFDLERARQSGIKVQFFSLFTHPEQADGCLRKILRQVNLLLVALRDYHDAVYLLTDSGQMAIEKNQDRVGALLHLEGGELFGSDIELLFLMHTLGLRSVGLTWNPANLLAGGVDSGQDQSGLTELGRRMLRSMEQLGVILDLSHISSRSFFEALECYNRPVMVTHANTWQLCPHRRNLTDQQLKALAENGGVIGFTQVSDFVREKEPVELTHFLDHIVYAAELIGVKHLALGSDFDGADKVVLPGVQAYPELTKALAERGFNQQEVDMIMGENALRLLKTII